MTHPRPRPGVVVRVSLSVALVAATAVAAGPTSGPAAGDVRAWVGRLSAGDRDTRVAAARAVWAAAGRADTGDVPPAAVVRAGLILARDVPFGNDDFPPAVLETADAYLAATPAERPAALKALADTAYGADGAQAVLARLLLADPDGARRAEVAPLARAGVLAAARAALADDAPDACPAADRVLDVAVRADPADYADDTAALAAATGRLPAALARWRNHPPAANARVLPALYRAAGDLPAALSLATDPADRRRLLGEAGRWLDLAEVTDAAEAKAVATAAPNPERESDETLIDAGTAYAVHTLHWRWAGQADRADRLLALAAARAAVSAAEVDLPGQIEMASDHPAQGLAELVRVSPQVAFGLLRFRGDVDAALALPVAFSRPGDATDPAADARQSLLADLGRLPPRPAAATPAADPDYLSWLTPVARRRFDAAVADLRAGRFDAAAAGFDANFGEPLTYAGTAWVVDSAALYLRGTARARAGQTAAGGLDVRRASALPLTNTFDRLHLAGELSAAGLVGAAVDEQDLALRVGDEGEPSALVALIGSAERAAARGDPATAAVAFERATAATITHDGSRIQLPPTSWLTLPWHAHLARARVARAAGDWPAVAAQLRACLALVPNDVGLAVEWVPVLDGSGQPALADEVFAATYGRWDGPTRTYPDSAWLHDGAARVAAGCGRRPAEAVAHARAAVRLGPKVAGYQATLADAAFAAGDREAAVTAAAAAAALAPADAGLARRLARVRSDPLPTSQR